MLPPLGHDPTELRDRAAELLARPPFVEEAPGPVGQLLARLGDVIAELLGRLFALAGGGGALSWAVVALATLVFGLVAWRLTRTAGLDRRLPGAKGAETHRSARDWDEAADAAAREGQLREAVRCRYAAVVVALAEAGLTDERPARTVGELDRAVAVAAPDLAPVVGTAGERFEEIWYGERRAGPDDDAAVQAALVAVRGVGVGS